jgi:hypothetical protein
MNGKLCTLLIGGLVACAAQAATPEADAAASLRARHAALGAQLANNQFQRPLHLDSNESADGLKGDIYALIERPIAEVSASLLGAAQWCNVMILHVNTKQCRAASGPGGATLTVHIGKKTDQPLSDAYPVEFSYRQVAATPEYFAVRLDAGKGPLGTRDYRILLEAVAVEGGRTFLHLTYAYGFGFSSRVAMQAYLSTAGAGKVGFSAAGRQPNGEPGFIGGMRGVVERNTMRYYLAIDAFLTAPGAGQLDTRLQAWFDATEQYRRQLHEVDRDAYLAMKHREVARQKAAQG